MDISYINWHANIIHTWFSGVDWGAMSLEGPTCAFLVHREEGDDVSYGFK